MPGCRGRAIPQQAPGCAVLLRTDMVGDHVIFGGFLERLREAWPQTRLVLVVPEVRRSLYTHCPCVDRIITYDYGRPGGPKAQREEVYRQVRAERPDWIINPMSLRSPISERIVRYCHARVRVGLAERPRPGHRRPRARFDRYYSHLVYDPAFTPWTSEISLQKALFRAMGLEPGDGRPRIWTAPEDAAFAEAFYRERNLQPGRTLVYFSTASSPLRSYPRLKSILADMLQGNSWSAIALGGEREYEANHPPSPALAARWINLCGQTTMAQSAEIMRRCRLVVGVDTGPLHVARAVGARHVVLLSGMFFGRFFPNGEAGETVVAHPLDCYFCEGECRYAQAHCITDLEVPVIRRALLGAMEDGGNDPRLYLSRGGPSEVPGAEPVFAWRNEWAGAAREKINSNHIIGPG